MAEGYSLSVQDSVALTRRITTLSVATAFVLSILKAGVWLSSGSVSVLASLADSGLDLIAAFGTFVAVRYAAAPPDAEHRFGHGKAEAFASLLGDGVYDYTYYARATTPGTFVVPPPKAEEMYSPETFGRGAGDRLVVE